LIVFLFPRLFLACIDVSIDSLSHSYWPYRYLQLQARTQADLRNMTTGFTAQQPWEPCWEPRPHSGNGAFGRKCYSWTPEDPNRTMMTMPEGSESWCGCVWKWRIYPQLCHPIYGLCKRENVKMSLDLGYPIFRLYERLIHDVW
jgi:hypothetical protein